MRYTSLSPLNTDCMKSHNGSYGPSCGWHHITFPVPLAHWRDLFFPSQQQYHVWCYYWIQIHKVKGNINFFSTHTYSFQVPNVVFEMPNKTGKHRKIANACQQSHFTGHLKLYLYCNCWVKLHYTFFFQLYFFYYHGNYYHQLHILAKLKNKCKILCQ